jgi:hypothetical protein
MSHANALRGAAGSAGGASPAGDVRDSDGSPTRIVFAAGGFQSGFAAIDERFCYEEGSAGALEQDDPSALSVSFFGDALDHRAEMRVHLHDRSKDAYPGHLLRSAEDPVAAALLSDAGREHYAWIEMARAVLLGGGGRGDGGAEIEELERRGLLGELGSRP